QELFTGSFFYEKKVLFIENLSLVFSKKNIKFDFIIDFFTKPNENIIIYLNEEKNKFPAEIKKQIYRYFNIVKKDKITAQKLFEYTKEEFEKDDFKIKKEIICLLIKKIHNNLFVLKEEIEKIKIYHLENKNIDDIKIIENLVSDSEEKNIFLLIKSIIRNNFKIENLQLLQYLISKKENTFFIVYQILNKLEEMIIVRDFMNQNKTNNEIASLLKYSVEKTFFLTKETKTLSIEKIKDLFLIFFDLYYKMKKGILKPQHVLQKILIKQLGTK
ncbi:DNA polymerase III subunit delta, partial ['Camptotheca acuminata' phytoplasma]|uniref:DNA polymerase III subunit delta n=1 Tax='Camptotheca acuminata' phytoplasma TaxID=3239192 RepID=UPI00351A03F3